MRLLSLFTRRRPQRFITTPCRLTLTVMALLACLSGCGNDGEPAELPSAAEPRFCRLPSAQVETRIDGLLAEMTLDEKLGQMVGSGGPIDGTWQTPDNPRLGIPGFRMMDGPRGVGVIAGKATAFPVGLARGASWDPDLEERIGEAIATELRAKGGNVILAPVTAILRHPLWGRGQETYGEDSLAIGRMGVGFIRGAQRHAIASVKHFAVNSIENTRLRVNVEIDERTLREIYLPHFKMAVDAQVGTVMAAYNQVNGAHCTENKHLLTDILKNEWGFQGLVESDWLAMRSAAASALAGLDLEMPTPLFYGPLLKTAIDSGAVPVATIDAAVRRILRTKLCFELDTKPAVVDPTQVESTPHTQLALESARQSIVLLKNEAGILPFDHTRLRSLVVVGAQAATANLGDNGSSAVQPSYAVAALDGIRSRAGQVAVLAIPSDTVSPQDETTIAAADAVVVVVGLTKDEEGEGLDRTQLELSSRYEDLISTVTQLNPNTVVVLHGGNAILVEHWINSVRALVMAWYPGQEGGNAIADVLFGVVNPSGKLPVVFARSAEQLPPFDNHTLRVTYGYYHGYRLLDRNEVEPRFPFGFGLSYTRYRYANLRLSPAALSRTGSVQVQADVTNTGQRAGDEVVQLYVGTSGSSVDRPVKDLRGFRKVHLQAGQTKTVTLDLAASDLAFYDVAAKGWEVEPIRYTVYVGSSERDLPLSGSFVINE